MLPVVSDGVTRFSFTCVAGSLPLDIEFRFLVTALERKGINVFAGSGQEVPEQDENPIIGSAWGNALMLKETCDRGLRRLTLRHAGDPVRRALC